MLSVADAYVRRAASLRRPTPWTLLLGWLLGLFAWFSKESRSLADYYGQRDYSRLYAPDPSVLFHPGTEAYERWKREKESVGGGCLIFVLLGVFLLLWLGILVAWYPVAAALAGAVPAALVLHHVVATTRRRKALHLLQEDALAGPRRRAETLLADRIGSEETSSSSAGEAILASVELAVVDRRNFPWRLSGRVVFLPGPDGSGDEIFAWAGEEEGEEVLAAFERQAVDLLEKRLGPWNRREVILRREGKPAPATPSPAGSAPVEEEAVRIEEEEGKWIEAVACGPAPDEGAWRVRAGDETRTVPRDRLVRGQDPASDRPREGDDTRVYHAGLWRTARVLDRFGPLLRVRLPGGTELFRRQSSVAGARGPAGRFLAYLAWPLRVAAVAALFCAMVWTFTASGPPDRDEEPLPDPAPPPSLLRGTPAPGDAVWALVRSLDEDCRLARVETILEGGWVRLTFPGEGGKRRDVRLGGYGLFEDTIGRGSSVELDHDGFRRRAVVVSREREEVSYRLAEGSGAGRAPVWEISLPLTPLLLAAPPRPLVPLDEPPEEGVLFAARWTDTDFVFACRSAEANASGESVRRWTVHYLDGTSEARRAEDLYADPFRPGLRVEALVLEGGRPRWRSGLIRNRGRESVWIVFGDGAVQQSALADLRAVAPRR